jgi:hypothetical protein
MWQQPELANANPDVTAKATISFPLPGTFPVNPDLYMAASGGNSDKARTAGPAKPNRYSAPYGE